MKLEGIYEWEKDKFTVCFPIPDVYYHWFRKYHELSGMGYEVIACHHPSGDTEPFAFIQFDSFAEALEFQMVNL